MLRAKMPGYVLRELGKALARYAELAPDDFATLFDPTLPRGPVRDQPELTRLIRICGLISGDAQIVGNHRIRRQGERFYLMELGGVEYYQDLWPETDALLALLPTLPLGRLLDLGCGCGIIALEARVLGHEVVATDLDPAAVELTRTNALLNGVEGVALHEGDLFAPVAGETFDAILAAPPCGRVWNQLRPQVLREGPLHVRPGGVLALATVLEWETSGVLPMVKVLDERLPSDITATIRPIESPPARNLLRTAEGNLPGIPSEHRFLVLLEKHAAGDAPASRPSLVTWPTAPPVRSFVPLSRLGESVGPRPRAVLLERADLTRLDELFGALETRELTLALPSGLHDGCRIGERPCVAAFEPAVGAILDEKGRVRPCAHGEPIATFDDDFDTLMDRYRAARIAASERRGCERCEARYFCSRCLHPTPWSEAEYCETMRGRARLLPQLRRLFDIGQQLAERELPSGPVRVHRSPWGTSAAIPPSEDDMGRVARRELDMLRERWNTDETWVVHFGDRAFLSSLRGGETFLVEVEPLVALLGEQIADGATATDLHRLAQKHGWQPSAVESARRKLATHLGLSGKV